MEGPSSLSFGLARQGVDISRRAAAGYFLAFVLVAAFAFYTNAPCLFFDWDGANWAVLMDYFRDFSSPFSIAMVDPTQGLFDIYMQGYRGLVPQNLVFALLGKPGLHKVMTHTGYAAALVLAVFALGLAAGFSRAVSLLAGFLLSALTLPMFKDDGFLDVLGNLNPNYTYVIALSTAVTALVWHIDGRSAVKTALLTLAAIALMLAVAWSFIFYFIYFCLVVAIMGFACLFADASRSALLSKLAAAVLAIAVMLAAGVPNYLYDLGSNMALNFFPEELSGDTPRDDQPPIRPTLRAVAIGIFDLLTGRFAWLQIAGLLGAVSLVALTSDRRLRTFSYGYIGLAVIYALSVIAAISWMRLIGRTYTGPTLYRIVPFMNPMACLFIVGLVMAASHFIWLGVGSLVRRHGAALDELRRRALSMARDKLRLDRGSRPGRWVWKVAAHFESVGKLFARSAANILLHAALLCVLAVPAALAASNNPGASQKRCSRPYFSPLERNAIVDYLEPRTALALGKPYRGSIATFTGPHNRREYTWVDNVTTDYHLWYHSGNDLRTIGLWHYRIPTLGHVSISITPQYFLTVSEFLSQRGDTPMRGIMTYTRPHDRMMALWGVRFVIADHPLGFGTQRLDMPVKLTDPPLYQSPIRLYELAGPNLGNYSPTEVVVAKDAKETLARMRADDFDGRRKLVTDSDLSGSFVPARDASMTVIEGGLALKAASEGQSILVLPVQYSHCWVPVAGSNVMLFRANLMQLGVRFSGQLSAEIQYRFGPFWNSRCRREDGRDAGRLDMAGARTQR